MTPLGQFLKFVDWSELF